MQIPPKYNHIEIEKKWYSYWMKNNLFKSIPNDKEPFTIVIPLLMLQDFFIWATCLIILFKIF
jgi:leucyl-tRNA synthetase